MKWQLPVHDFLRKKKYIENHGSSFFPLQISKSHKFEPKSGIFLNFQTFCGAWMSGSCWVVVGEKSYPTLEVLKVAEPWVKKSQWHGSDVPLWEQQAKSTA